MLYEGALKFCNQAMVALEQEDLEKTSNYICKTQEILREFQITLDRNQEISGQLNALYDYLLYRLTQANIRKDLKMLEEARLHLRSLRDTWKEAMKLAKQGPAAANTARTRVQV